MDEEVRSVGEGQLPLQALDLQEGQAQGQQHQPRRDHAVDPVGPAAPRAERTRQVAGDQPDQERHHHADRGHLLDERQAEQDPDQHAPAPAVFLHAVRSRRPGAMAAQSKSPGMSVSIRCAWP